MLRSLEVIEDMANKSIKHRFAYTPAFHICSINRLSYIWLHWFY